MFVPGRNGGASEPGSREDAIAGRSQQRGSAEPLPTGGDQRLAELAEELAQLASNLAAGTCRWLELLGEFDAHDGWTEWRGVRSCSEWVSWRCSLDRRSAREHVRVARALRELPRIQAQFSSGRLSYSKVRALTRVADADSEMDLIALARNATAAQLDRMLGAYRRVTREEANDAQRSRYLTYSVEDDGSVRISGHVPADDAATILAALDRAQADLRETAYVERAEALEGGSAEPPDLQREPTHATRVDALVAISEATLARGIEPVSGDKRTELVVHADLNTLSFDTNGGVHTTHGLALAPDTARRLGCDSATVTSLERAGEVLSIGRRTRAVPTPIRRALEIRDKGCRFPGCANHRGADAHHVRHWSQGGETSLANLILLCRRHHRLLHEGEYGIEQSGVDEFRFRHARGWIINAEPEQPAGDATALPAGGGLQAGSGERMDLGACVSAVFQAVDPDTAPA